MKFVCQLEGFAENWIEFSDVWTRREGKDLFELPERDAFDKYVPLKAVACHIEIPGGKPITDPQALTYDGLDNIDARLFGFLARALFNAYTELTRLGNASARLSSSTNGIAMMAAPTNQAH